MNSVHWNIAECDGIAARRLCEKTGVNGAMSRLLVSRGFEADEILERFLDPRLASLNDPFELPDMEPAVTRIWRAIDQAEPIAVFGDYDVDGVTSTALLTRSLKELGAVVSPFIPDRLDEGYGLSQNALERCLLQSSPRLLITVDCGTNSRDSIAYAVSKCVDVIVTDHHEPDGELPDALALINPKLADREQNKKLCGAGIAFKLMHALIKHGRNQNKASAQHIDLRHYLDFVAVGTVADIVPLRGENRILVRHGLRQLSRTRWPGMKALVRMAKIEGEPTSYHVGFQIGPRINAAGRIGEPMSALQLLLTDDQAEAEELAGLLDEHNIERRLMERTMTDEAIAEIDDSFDPETHFGLVVARKGWHPGVVGIVASRVCRHFNRPSIIMGIDESGCARGSCRSIGQYNILEGLQACEHLLNTFGGHYMAAGIEVKRDAVDTFRTEFNRAVFMGLKDVDLTPVLSIDSIAEGNELDWNFYSQLNNLRPFGQDNREPIWMLENVKVAGVPRVVGQKHLKLSVEASGHRFDAIAFNYALDELPAGRIDVAFVLKENNWQGNRSLQLQVEGIRPTACGKS